MESIKVINGRGNVSKEKINILLDAAIELYGSKYEQIVLAAVRNTIIYEMKPHENIKKAIQNISGNSPKIYGKMPKACHLSLGSIEDNAVSVVIWKPQNRDEDYYVLAHELYGHSVCGRENPMIRTKYSRNGISLYDLKTGKTKLELLNEGFMEVIAKRIINKTDRNITESLSERYQLARKSASYIWNVLGKDKVLDDLIEYHGTIEKEYNQEADGSSLILFNHLLEQEVQMRKLQKIFPSGTRTLEQKVKKELVKFKKRKNKIR